MKIEIDKTNCDGCVKQGCGIFTDTECKYKTLKQPTKKKKLSPDLNKAISLLKQYQDIINQDNTTACETIVELHYKNLDLVEELEE